MGKWSVSSTHIYAWYVPICTSTKYYFRFSQNQAPSREKNCVPRSCCWTAKPRNATAVSSLFQRLIFIVSSPQGTLEASLGLDTFPVRSIFGIRRRSNSAKMEIPGNSPLTRSSDGLPGHPVPSDRVRRCGCPGKLYGTDHPVRNAASVISLTSGSRATVRTSGLTSPRRTAMVSGRQPLPPGGMS